MAKVLISYQFDRTGPGYPLYAEYDWFAQVLVLEAHTPVNRTPSYVQGIKTARQLWDAMMQAKREHEAAHKEGK